MMMENNIVKVLINGDGISKEGVVIFFEKLISQGDKGFGFLFVDIFIYYDIKR